MSDIKPRKHLEWNLHVVMAKRKVRRVTDLHRMLLEVGVDISSTQLSRIVAQRPKRITTEVLDGLVTVLNCEISDLLVLEENVEESQPALAVSSKPKAHHDPDLTGPDLNL